MSASLALKIGRRVTGNCVWLGYQKAGVTDRLARIPAVDIRPEVLASEDAVGRAQFEELRLAAKQTDRDLVVILLGDEALGRCTGWLVKKPRAPQLTAC